MTITDSAVGRVNWLAGDVNWPHDVDGLTRRGVIEMTDGLSHLGGRRGRTSTPPRARWPFRHPAVTSRPLRRVARIVYFDSSAVFRVSPPPHDRRNPPPGRSRVRTLSVICFRSSALRRQRLQARTDRLVSNHCLDSFITVAHLLNKLTDGYLFVSELVVERCTFLERWIIRLSSCFRQR